jgi:HEAT repeat protein
MLSRAVVLLLPAGLMTIASQRTTDRTQLLLWLGAAFQLIVCLFAFVSRQTWRQPIGPSVVALYLIGLGWTGVASYDIQDWFLYLAEAVLLLIPLGVFAAQTLSSTGAPVMRRARLLADRLSYRPDWPADLMACRSLPEVKAFREALHLDATPALALLSHPRLPVRVAALAALEFRKEWRPGQPQLVLQVAKASQEPAIRAAAVSALANVDDRPLVESLTEFLRDPNHVVRRSAAEALLWDCERRWPWIRNAIRITLADPALTADGPLLPDGGILPPDPAADLNAWAAEKGSLGVRAALTLGVHYGQVLSDCPDDEVVHSLQRKVLDPHAAPTLRLELARLLQAHRCLEPEMLNELLGTANPAPLRLIAAEALLNAGSHPEALAALRDIARLPNREMALATAAVVQRRLGIAFGLEEGKPLPALHTRQAAEVTRRVMHWAAQQAAAASNPQPVATAL